MSTPWFQNPELCRLVDESYVETANLKSVSFKGPNGKDANLGVDSREYSPVHWQRTKSLIIPLAGVMGVFNLVNTVIIELGAPVSIWGTASALTFLLSTLALGFAAAVKATACGRPLSHHEAARRALDRWPVVMLTYILTGMALMLGFLMCLLPGLILLPYVARAPYEAALGRSTLESFKRSFWIARRLGESASTVSNTLFRIVIALACLGHAGAAITGTFGLSPLWMMVLTSPISIGVSFIVWNELMSAFAIQDAVLAGALHTGNLAEDRLPMTSKWNQHRNGRSGEIVRIVVVLGGFFLILWNGGLGMGGSSVVLPPGETAPPIVLTNLAGEEFDVAQNDGEPTVVYFWAPWCGPCKGQVGELNDFQKERPKVNVVAVALQYEDEAELHEYVKEQGVEYEILVGTDEVSKDYKITAFPSLVVLNSSSEVVWSQTGVASTGALEDVVDGLKAPAAVE